MNGTYETKRYGADKIALLGLFIAALLIAHVIVVSRSAIVLSDPIKLPHAGLSLSMPAGNGWQSQQQWRYHQRSFTLSSDFAPRFDDVVARVSCRYLLSDTEAAADIRFQQRASAVGGLIKKTNQLHTGELVVDWAQIEKPNAQSGMIFGTVRLANGRQLDIEVLQDMADMELARKVFDSIANTIKFEDPAIDLVATIKSKGIGFFLDDQRSRQVFFLVRDAADHVIGFTTDVLIDTGRNAELNIQAASFSYIVQGRYASEQVETFRGDDRLARFVWKSEVSSLDGESRIGTEITLGRDGNIVVKQSDDPHEEISYPLNPVAIPALFLESLFRQMLDSDYKELIVDMIHGDGSIRPTLVRLDVLQNGRVTPSFPPAKSEDTGAAGQGVAYIFTVKSLDERGVSQLVYLDQQRQISSILLKSPKTVRDVWELLQPEDVYIVERTDANNIIRYFPERANEVLRGNKILEQN